MLRNAQVACLPWATRALYCACAGGDTHNAPHALTLLPGAQVVLRHIERYCDVLLLASMSRLTGMRLVPLLMEGLREHPHVQVLIPEFVHLARLYRDQSDALSAAARPFVASALDVRTGALRATREGHALAMTLTSAQLVQRASIASLRGGAPTCLPESAARHVTVRRGAARGEEECDAFAMRCAAMRCMRDAMRRNALHGNVPRAHAG
jgi:hypothetical protein